MIGGGVTDEQIVEMEKASSVRNTDRNTRIVFSRFDHYREDRGVSKDLLEMTIQDLMKHLKIFFTGLRQLNGKEYRTNSIENCLAAIARHLRSNYIQEESLNIMSDKRFAKL